MLKLAHGLAGRGHEVDLVLARAEGPYLDQVSEGVGLVDLDARRVATSLPGLVRYLRSKKPDALVATWEYANVVALWARRLARVPMRAIVIDQNTVSKSARHASTLRGRLMPWLMKRFYPWADYVIGNSAGVADDLRHITRLPDHRIRVVYNPIVTDDIAIMAREPVDHPWFRDGDPVLMAAGRLRPQKDFPTLIRAFAKVRERRMVRLVILGEGSEHPALEALAKELGVHAELDLHPFVDNPYAYMARASLFVLSSRWEGLPTVLVEALRCGARIVSTDCPSGPREILAGGRYGRLVPVGDVNALAAAIGDALDETESPELPDESWTPYQMDTIVDQYLELLAEPT